MLLRRPRERQTENRTVVINATNLGSALDGIGIYALNLVRELARLRTSLSFIIYVNRSAREHVREIRFPAHCRVVWVPSILSPDNGFRGHLLRLVYANYLGVKHRRLLIFTASQLEVVFFRFNQVVMIHDLIPFLFKKCHKKQYYYYEYILRHALKGVRQIITPSHHTRGLLEQCFGLPRESVRVIHHGALGESIDHPPVSMESGTPFILYTGRITRMKNITGVLKAFALIQDKVPHKLVLTGHGRQQLHKEFDAARLARYHLDPGRVEFKGHVSMREMVDLLHRASLLVFPSFYEGFGLPPLEAMGCGCPVVVSHVASLPEVCGDAAYYVDPYNTEAIADGMYTVVTDEKLRRTMIERGIERAARFRWANSAREHVGIFTEILQPVAEALTWNDAGRFPTVQPVATLHQGALFSASRSSFG